MVGGGYLWVYVSVCEKIIKKGRQMSPVRKRGVTQEKSAQLSQPLLLHSVNRRPAAKDEPGSDSVKQDTDNTAFVLRSGYTLRTLPCLRDLQLQ